MKERENQTPEKLFSMRSNTPLNRHTQILQQEIQISPCVFINISPPKQEPTVARTRYPDEKHSA